MFSRLFGVTCIRPGCGHKNPQKAEFCQNCGISLDFNRPAILDGNQWQPAPDELAAFFKFKDMKKGFFTKTLYVPGGMKAWVLQDDPKKPVMLLNEGAHTIETLFQRMNNFFSSSYGDVLVAKTGSVPLNMEFDDLRSLEGLMLKAHISLRLRVRVGEDEQRPDLAAFRRHFMQRPGALTAAMLGRPDVLGQTVKSALSSFVRGRGVDEMAANTELANELDTHMRNRLGGLLLDFGLELFETIEITLVHPKLDELNRQQGELWLLRREKQQEQDHASQLTDLYDAKECEALRARRLEIQRKRLAGELDAEDAELAHALRLREVQQYECILEARTREEAARLGAADEVKELEHFYEAKRRSREHQAMGERMQAEEQQAQWAHVQALARIRRDAALKLEALKQEQELKFAHERAINAMRQEAADLQMKEALKLADELQRRAALAASVEEAIKAKLRAEQLADAQAKADADAIALAAEVRRMEAERLQRVADAEADRRIALQERVSTKERSDDALLSLTRLIEIDHQDELNQQRREDERLDKELDRKIKERQQLINQELTVKALELSKISLTTSLSTEQLVLLADNPHKIEALVKLSTINAHKEMTAETIMASVQASRGAMPPAPAAPAGPSALDERRRTQQSDGDLIGQIIGGFQSQNTQFLNVIEKMAAGMRDVGVANATGATPNAPTVVVAAAAPWAAPQQPVAPAAAAPAVLHQAFLSCGHCHSLNPPGARFCTNCGQPLAR